MTREESTFSPQEPPDEERTDDAYSVICWM